MNASNHDDTNDEWDRSNLRRQIKFDENSIEESRQLLITVHNREGSSGIEYEKNSKSFLLLWMEL